MNKTDYTRPLLVQDDCAPDAMQYFLAAFRKEMGMTLNEFKSIATKEGEEDWTEWALTSQGIHYRVAISADDPYYKLYKTEIE